MAEKAKTKYTEVWAEVRATLNGRDIVYGGKAKVVATDDKNEVRDAIFYDALTNLNEMIDTLQSGKK